MYYNPQTKEIITKSELQNKLNCSFPDWTETVGDYFLIHSDNIPGTNAEIVFKDNKYVQTHIPIEPSQPKTQEITDADSRINFPKIPRIIETKSAPCPEIEKPKIICE